MNTRKTNTKRDQLLTLVGLKGNERIRIMSRGMKQRLGIAAALVTNPDVLLLDEPTSALDPMGRHELMEIMKQLREDGKTIILSTHILADMERVCDKVGFLHNGSIQREVRINDLLSGREDTWEITFDCSIISLICLFLIAIDVLILTSSPMLSSIIIFSVPGVSTQKNSDISL